MLEQLWFHIQSSRFVWAFGIPALITVVGIFGKHLQIPEPSFKWACTYAGVDLALGAITSSALHLAEPGTKDDAVGVLFLSVALVVFVALLSLTKLALPKENQASRWKDRLVLDILGNLIDFVLLAVAVWVTLPG